MAEPILKALLFPLLLSLASLSQAATVTYDWNITWVRTNPDGQHERPTIGINGKWPLPHLTATVGDHIVINVDNQLGNQSTSLHFHGLYMNGSTHMDGPVGVSQCAIAPGTTFKYNFTIDQPGTYWYHSHDSGQYPDGLRAPLVVHDPDFPYHYDEEIILTLSDWYHDQMPGLIKKFISYANPTGAEPVPNSALMNDTQNLTVAVEPGKTYLVRMVNMGAFAGQYIWFENHTMQIVEADGIYTEPAEADMIYLTAAQRYSVLLTTKNDTASNFAFVASMDKALFDKVPPKLNPNVTGWLVYDEAKDLPKPAILESFNPHDDFTLVPTDREELYENVDHSIKLDVTMGNLGNGANYAFFNDVTYVRPKVPTLYSALSTGLSASNTSVYGVNTNAFVLKRNEVVEIVLNNNDPGRHPFHLHGHVFQTIMRSPDNAGYYTNNETFPKVPMKRDTVLVRPNGNLVLRFRADNPDKSLLPFPSHPSTWRSANIHPSRVWLFHCHIEWHVASGLVATMIEAPEALQASLSIPTDHLAACATSNTPTAGNAAGNSQDLFNLKGATTSPKPLPAGFTPKGIVALVFSCVSAVVGVAVIVWYGVGEIGKKEEGILEGKIEDVARRVGVVEVAEPSSVLLHRRGEGAGVVEK